MTKISYKLVENPDEFVFEDVMSCEDARDVIAEKYPNRKVISVQERKTPDELAQEDSKTSQDAL